MGRTYIRPDRDNTQYGYINTTNRSKTENRHDWTFAYELSRGPAQAALTNPTGCRNAQARQRGFPGHRGSGREGQGGAAGGRRVPMQRCCGVDEKSTRSSTGPRAEERRRRPRRI